MFSFPNSFRKKPKKSKSFSPKKYPIVAERSVDAALLAVACVELSVAGRYAPLPRRQLTRFVQSKQL